MPDPIEGLKGLEQRLPFSLVLIIRNELLSSESFQRLEAFLQVRCSGCGNHAHRCRRNIFLEFPRHAERVRNSYQEATDEPSNEGAKPVVHKVANKSPD